MFSAFSFALLSPPLLLRYSSASKPLQVRSLEWEVNGNHMGLTWEEEGRKKGFSKELITLEVYTLPSILAIFILSFWSCCISAISDMYFSASPEHSPIS